MVLPSQLPIWIEYAKALGAPIVAFLAALVAGGIAYRQWVTARNKLKLDFFDRRVEIYTAAIDVINWMAQPNPSDSECIAVLRKHTATARWLLSATVAEYLIELNKRARLAEAEDRPFKAIYDEGGEEALLNNVRERTNQRKAEILALDQLFEPYLSVRH